MIQAQPGRLFNDAFEQRADLSLLVGSVVAAQVVALGMLAAVVLGSRRSRGDGSSPG